MSKKTVSPAARLWKGIFSDNPVLVLMLGLCPALGTTASVQTALAMGIATAIVLVLTEFVVSLLRNAIPQKAVVTVSVLLAAVFTTIVDFQMAEHFPELQQSLSIYIPLIAVSSVVLCRVSDCASSEPMPAALCDAVGMGIGFTASLVVIGSIREILGAGTWYGLQVMPAGYQPMAAFSMAPGAFFILAFLAAAVNCKARRGDDQTRDEEGQS